MKRSMVQSSIQLAALLAGSVALWGQPALAQNYYWDPVSGNGVVDGGTGVWDMGNTWTTDSGVTNIPWTNGQNVYLTVAPGTITLNGSVSPGGNLYATVDGYVITGGTLALTSFTYIQPSAGVNLRIESPITGNLNYGTSGGGRTILAGDNSGKTGGIWNMESTLQAAHDNALGAGQIFWNGGYLENTGSVRTFNNTYFGGNYIRVGGNANFTLTTDISYGTGSVNFQNNSTNIVTFTGKISGGDALADNFNVNNNGLIVHTNAANDYTATVNLETYLRVGTNGAGLSSNANLNFTSGVLESNGTFNRTLGSGAGQVQWTAGFSGGFAGHTSKLTVDLENLGTRDTLTWGGFFVPAGPGSLTFGTPYANSEVEFYDNLDMGSTDRVITVLENLNSSSDVAVVSGTISSSSGNASLSKRGDGVLVLTGTNTYTGAQTSIDAGALRGEFGVGIPSTSYINLQGTATNQTVWETNGTKTIAIQPAAGAIFWNGAGGGVAAVGGNLDLTLEAVGYTLNWGGQFDGFTSANLHLSSRQATDVATIVNNINLGNTARTVTVFDNPDLTTDWGRFAGNLSGVGGSLIKQGPGILEVTGNNTYDSGTTVEAGTLLVNNTAGSGTGSGSVIVQTGATLGGTGSIDGAVTVQSGGFLKPGASIGTLTVNNSVSMASNTTLTIELGAASAADLLSLTGAFTIDDTVSTGTTLALVNAGGAWDGGDYQIITAGTFTQQFATAKVTGLDSGYYLDYSTANELWLRVLATALLGDLNGDNVVNNQDIAPFVLALTDLATWQSTYPTLNILQVGDINGDNVFNNQDIAPFVTLLTGSGTSLTTGEVNAIPEPASLGLLAIGGLMLIARRRRA